MSALETLTDLILRARGAPEGTLKPAIQALLGERYHKNVLKDVQVRDAYALARDDLDAGVPWAGLINPDNPTSGPYGGTSLVWFPGETSTLIGLGVGTRGISPDEGILTRPGHRRRTAALRRVLARRGITAWSKTDPAALGVRVPKVVVGQLPDFSAAFKRYGHEMYLIAHVPSERASAEPVVRSFFDLYAFERGWQALAARAPEVDALLADLRRELFISPSAETINDLLRQRRFVVLQGPPGTGKTRLADTVRREFFGGRGLTIQFHPSVTYEDFVIGLSPDPAEGQLHFRVRPGALMEAVQQATESPFVLVVDEVNRADLGKVLGEAIYLFEAGEVGGDRAREVRLPHSVDGRSTLRLPEHLYVLGTMNTADRSIASVDLAIRRRFAFLTIPPDRAAVEQGGTPKSLEAFDRLTDVFVEHAPEDALELLPGHAYFLAPDEPTFAKRLRYEILPLLDEYLRQGYLGAASAELQAVRDSLEGQLSLDGTT